MLRPRAIAGSSAQKALEKKMTQLDRTKRVRILGEYRTYRTAANVAPRIVSTGSAVSYTHLDVYKRQLSNLMQDLDEFVGAAVQHDDITCLIVRRN